MDEELDRSARAAPAHLLTRKQVAQRLNVHPNNLGALIRRGLIPEPRYLSARRPRWLQRDVESALERIAAGSRGAAGNG